MSFRSASGTTDIYIGILRAAAYARNASANSSADMHETTTFVDPSTLLRSKYKSFVPGTNTSTFSVDGPVDSDGSANGQWDSLADIKGATTNTPITYLPLGSDGAAWLLDGIETQLMASASISATSDWSVEAQTTGITDVNGFLLEDNVTVTTDTDGSNLDNGAATTGGAVAHLHVTAFSGLTSDDIIIEGSANGSTGWATVVTFTQVTGLTSERVEVSGSVARYLRVADDVTGTGSITRTVAISRR